MCYKEKCIYCIKVETGSLIFGILTAIFTGIGSLLAIGTCIYANIVINTPDAPKLFQDVSPYDVNIVFLIILWIMLPGFTFSVVLIKGLVRRNPDYVKAYYNYGVFVICLTLAGISFGAPIPVQLTIVIGAIYYLILRMVRMTYKKLRSNKFAQYGNTNFDEKKLPLP